MVPGKQCLLHPSSSEDVGPAHGAWGSLMPHVLKKHPGLCHRCPHLLLCSQSCPLSRAPQPWSRPGTTVAMTSPICQGQSVAWACHTSRSHFIAWSLMQRPWHREDPELLPRAPTLPPPFMELAQGPEPLVLPSAKPLLQPPPPHSSPHPDTLDS